MPPTIAVVDRITPLETYRKFYQPNAGLLQCEGRTRECFVRKSPPDKFALTSSEPLTISDTSTQLSQSTVCMSLIQKPSILTIVCAGFHELFLSPNAFCSSDIQKVNIVTAVVAAV